MTGMLASVCNLSEAKQAQIAKVDIIDLKNPASGALGALDMQAIEKIVNYINGAIPLSATIGDLDFDANILHPVIRRMALTGVDIIKVGVFKESAGTAEIDMLSRLSDQGMRIVLVMFAELYKDNYDLKILGQTGITGVMLDTMNKESGSLLEKLPVSVLQDFVNQTGEHGLLSGLAGSLSEKDIPDLLELKADYLGFRGGLCEHGQRQNILNQNIINRVRRKIPADDANILNMASMA